MEPSGGWGMRGRAQFARPSLQDVESLDTGSTPHSPPPAQSPGGTAVSPRRVPARSLLMASAGGDDAVWDMPGSAAGSPAHAAGGKAPPAPLTAKDRMTDAASRQALREFEEKAQRPTPRVLAPWRMAVRGAVLDNGALDRFIAVVILFNSVTMALEKPHEPTPTWIDVAETVFFGLYVAELVLKVTGYTWWGRPRAYFGYTQVVRRAPPQLGVGGSSPGAPVSPRELSPKGPPGARYDTRWKISWWGVLDFIVVVGGALEASRVFSQGAVKTLKSFRLLRPLKAVAVIPAMRVLLKSIIASIRKLVDATLLFTLFLIGSSIIGVQLFKGILHQRCFPNADLFDAAEAARNASAFPPGRVAGLLPGAPASVPELEVGRHCSNATVLRGYACSWGATCVADAENPFREHFDHVPAAFMMLLVAVTKEGWANMMYSTIDASNPFAAAYYMALTFFGAFCFLNLTVVIVNHVFDYSQALEAAKVNLKVKAALEAESVAQKRDAAAAIDFPKNHTLVDMTRFQRSLLSVVASQAYQWITFLTIVVNIISLCLWHDGIHGSLLMATLWMNMFCTSMFVLDSTLNLFVWRPRTFFKSRWNIFDLVIAVVSLVHTIWENPWNPPPEHADDQRSDEQQVLQVIRSMQVLRVFKIIVHFPRLKRWSRVLLSSIGAASSLMVLLMIFIFIYALLGKQLFATRLCDLAARDPRRTAPKWAVWWAGAPPAGCVQPRAHFDDVLTASLTLFQILSGEDWQFIFYNGVAAAGDGMGWYFVTWFFLANTLLLNLFVSIMIDRLRYIKEEDDAIGEHNRAWRKESRSLKHHERLKALDRYLSSASDDLEDGQSQAGSVAPAKQQVPVSLLASAMLKACVGRVRKVELCGQALCPKQEDEAQRRGAKNRDKLGEIMESGPVELLIGGAILASCVVLTLYDPRLAPDSPKARAIAAAEVAITVVFAVECFLKIVAFGFVVEPHTYLRRDRWNRLDFLIVVTSLMSALSPAASVLSNLKTLQAIRVLRPLRFINKFRSLQVVVESMWLAIPSLGIVMLLGFLMWLVFGILGVVLFSGKFNSCTEAEWGDQGEAHPNRTSCLDAGLRWTPYPANFDHVLKAFLTLFEMATLEGWVEVMYVGMDSVSRDQAPRRNNRAPVVLYFVAFILFGAFFLVNLFVSAMVDAFQEQGAKRQDVHSTYAAMQTEEQRMWQVFQTNLMQHVVLPVEVSPSTNRFRRACSHVATARWFANAVNTAIFINVAVLAAEWHSQPEGWTVAADYLNIAFVVLFVIEAFVKIVAYTPRRYLLIGMNRFDLFVVATSVLGIVLDYLQVNSFSTVASVFRALRLLRLLKLVHAARGVQSLLETLLYTFPRIVNVTGIMLLFFFVYAILGIFLFGRVKHGSTLRGRATFDSFWPALSILVRIATGEGWPGLMHDTAVTPPDCDPRLDECGEPALSYLYFLSFVIIETYVILNVFIAILLDAFTDSIADEVCQDNDDPLFTSGNVGRFFRCWRKHDPLQTCTMAVEAIPDFLRSLGPPLGPEPPVSDLLLYRNYIRKMADMRIHDGRVAQGDLMTHLYLIHFETQTGETVPPQLRRAFQKRLRNIFRARLVSAKELADLDDEDDATDAGSEAPHEPRGMDWVKRALFGAKPDETPRGRHARKDATLGEHDFWLNYVAVVVQRSWRRAMYFRKVVRLYRAQRERRAALSQLPDDVLARVLDGDPASASGSSLTDATPSEASDGDGLFALEARPVKKKKKKRRAAMAAAESDSDGSPRVPAGGAARFFGTDDVAQLLLPMEREDRLYNPLKYDRCPATQRTLRNERRQAVLRRLEARDRGVTFAATPVTAPASTPPPGLWLRRQAANAPSPAAPPPLRLPAGTVDRHVEGGAGGDEEEGIPLGADFTDPVGEENAEDRTARTAEHVTHFYCPPHPWSYSFADVLDGGSPRSVVAGGGGGGGSSVARSRAGSAASSALMMPSYGSRSALRFPPLKPRRKRTRTPPGAAAAAAAPRWGGFAGSGLEVSLLATNSSSEPSPPGRPPTRRLDDFV